MNLCEQAKIGYLLKLILFLSICRHSLVLETRNECLGPCGFGYFIFYLPLIITDYFYMPSLFFKLLLYLDIIYLFQIIKYSYYSNTFVTLFYFISHIIFFIYQIRYSYIELNITNTRIKIHNPSNIISYNYFPQPIEEHMLPMILKQGGSIKNTNLLQDESAQNDVIITAIKQQEPKQKIVTKNYQVYVIQDSTPPTTFPPNQKYTNLPSTVQFSRIVANVITSLSTSYFKQIESKKNKESGTIIEKWTKYLNLQENKALVSDCFWFAICKFFRAGEFANSQKQLQKRIADNYIGLFLSIQQKHENQLFFKEYFNVLAQSVFYSFFYAYPKSRSKFSNKLKDQLLSMFSQMFTGVQISNTKAYYDKWTLDLGTGNILAKKPKNTEHDQMAKTTDPTKKTKISFNSSVFERTKKRQTLPIRYSPIVELYLKNHKYKTRNYVSQFKMKYSQADRNDKQKQAKFAEYRNEATRILEWSQNQKQQQQAKRQQLQSQIKAIKRQTINHHKRLDRRKAEELERGAHQYANYLVSMLNAGITMTSLGVIRKNIS